MHDLGADLHVADAMVVIGFRIALPSCDGMGHQRAHGGLEIVVPHHPAGDAGGAGPDPRLVEDDDVGFRRAALGPELPRQMVGRRKPVDAGADHDVAGLLGKRHACGSGRLGTISPRSAAGEPTLLWVRGRLERVSDMGRLECDWPPSRLRGSQRRKLLQGRRIWLMPCTRKRRKSADPGSWTIRQMQDRVQALLHQRRQGCSLPQAFYVDEEMFQADLQAVFAADWLFACNTCEIKNPGDYITLAIGQDLARRAAGPGRRGQGLPQRLPPPRLAHLP